MSGTITDEGWGILHDRTGTPLRAATAAEWKRSEERDVRGFYQVVGSPYGNPEYQDHVVGGPDGTVDADAVRALLAEAAQAGDAEQVRLCEVALGRAPGDSDRAWYACGQVILGNRVNSAS